MNTFEMPIQGIGRPRFIVNGSLNSSASNANNFYSITGIGSDLTGTEANVTTTLLTGFKVKRVMGRPYISTKSGSTTFELRVNSATVTGATFTITAGSTATFDSGELNVIVPAGSTIDWRCDTTASASGNIAIRATAELEVI